MTLALTSDGSLPRRFVLPYIAAPVAGAVIGVWLAHLMFDVPLSQTSVRVRSGIGQWADEFIATFGLIAVIERGRRYFAAALPACIASYITAAYWFTSSSTSFANPAVTLARSLTDSFAGIGPNNVVGFILAQCLGALSASLLLSWLLKEPQDA